MTCTRGERTVIAIFSSEKGYRPACNCHSFSATQNCRQHLLGVQVQEVQYKWKNKEMH